MSMIVLDYQDRRPLYEQVEEKFRNLILMGVLEPGSRMPLCGSWPWNYRSTKHHPACLHAAGTGGTDLPG